MRLFHELLIPHLPRQQLLGQHRECAALRGLGWGRKHSTVDYVFRHSPYKLYQYHMAVMSQILDRGYNVAAVWYSPYYRGKQCPKYTDAELGIWADLSIWTDYSRLIYPEHDEAYLRECLDNLAGKGVVIKGVAP